MFTDLNRRCVVKEKTAKYNFFWLDVCSEFNSTTFFCVCLNFFWWRWKEWVRRFLEMNELVIFNLNILIAILNISNHSFNKLLMGLQFNQVLFKWLSDGITKYPDFLLFIQLFLVRVYAVNILLNVLTFSDVVVINFRLMNFRTKRVCFEIVALVSVWSSLSCLFETNLKLCTN
jgi:hypothetical protein